MLLHILLLRIMILLNEKKIKAFINTRQQLSENTKLAYFYDLRAFIKFVDGKPLTQTILNLFQLELRTLAPASQHRKVSTINLFLKYLYQSGDITQYYELESISPLAHRQTSHTEDRGRLIDITPYYHQVQKPGDLLVLLILEFGLKPSEIQTLKWADFNWDFKILTVAGNGIKRILPIRERFSRLARPIKNGDELFTKSRQFLHYELKKTTSLSSASLREQYILQRVAEKMSIYKLAESLGLKSIQTLDKYYR